MQYIYIYINIVISMNLYTYRVTEQERGKATPVSVRRQDHTWFLGMGGILIHCVYMYA